MATAWKGTSFPSTPDTDDIFYKEDAFGSGIGAWCYYDGTRWLTAELFEKNIEKRTLSANESTNQQWVGDTYALYFERFEVRTNVATTNDANSYWDVSARSEALDGTVTVVSTISTGDTPDSTATAYDHGEDCDAPAPANYGGIFFRAQKGGATGTPGNLTYSATVTYRKIIT